MTIVSETEREIGASNQIRIQNKSIYIAISMIAPCTLLLITIPILITHTKHPPTDDNSIQHSTIYPTNTSNYGFTQKPYTQTVLQTEFPANIDITASNDITTSNDSTVTETDQSCKCRTPFQPTRNCTLCFFLPKSDDFGVFEKYDLLDKNDANQQCRDKFQGEIPSSEFQHSLHTLNHYVYIR